MAFHRRTPGGVRGVRRNRQHGGDLRRRVPGGRTCRRHRDRNRFFWHVLGVHLPGHRAPFVNASLRHGRHIFHLFEDAAGRLRRHGVAHHSRRHQGQEHRGHPLRSPGRGRTRSARDRSGLRRPCPAAPRRRECPHPDRSHWRDRRDTAKALLRRCYGCRHPPRLPRRRRADGPTEEQDSAVFKAASAAIRQAEQRLAPAG